MRKVFVEIEASVLVPVKIKGTFVLIADDDARIATALKQLSRGRRPAQADLDDVTDVRVVKIGSYVGSDDLESAVEEILIDGKFELHSSTVLDSK